MNTFFHVDLQKKRNQPQAKGSSHLRHLTSYNESLLLDGRGDLKGSKFEKSNCLCFRKSTRSCLQPSTWRRSDQREAKQPSTPSWPTSEDNWNHLWTILPLNSGQDNWNHLGTLVLVEFCSPSSEQSLNNGLGRWVEHHFFFFCFTDQMSQPLHCLLSAKQIRSS